MGQYMDKEERNIIDREHKIIFNIVKALSTNGIRMICLLAERRSTNLTAKFDPLFRRLQT